MPRSLWMGLFVRGLVNLLLNVCLAWMITNLLGGTEQLLTFAFFLAVLVFGPIVFNLKDALVTACLNWFGLKTMRQRLLIDIQRANMPTDEEYIYFDADEYLAQVAQNEEATPQQRMKAVEYTATLAAFRQTARVFSMFFTAALNGAVQDHFLRNPPPRDEA